MISIRWAFLKLDSMGSVERPSWTEWFSQGFDIKVDSNSLQFSKTEGIIKIGNACELLFKKISTEIWIWRRTRILSWSLWHAAWFVSVLGVASSDWTAKYGEGLILNFILEFVQSESWGGGARLFQPIRGMEFFQLRCGCYSSRELKGRWVQCYFNSISTWKWWKADVLTQPRW